MLANGPEALAETKALALESSFGGMAVDDEAYKRLVRMHSARRMTPEASEGLASFAEITTARLEWLKARAGQSEEVAAGSTGSEPPQQGLLWTVAAYQEEAPAIRTAAELAGALEHLEYVVHRRYQNQLTRAERARLSCR